MAKAIQLRTLEDIAAFLAASKDCAAAFRAVAALGLPDCWIGAGFVRSRVWDALAGRATAQPKDDIDVVYFDPADTTKEKDLTIEAALGRSAPEHHWSVKNQARMHGRNGDAPYRDTIDAMAHWPETATAIAARLEAGAVVLAAPYGVDDLVDLVVRPTPIFRHKMNVFRARLAAKNWRARWPEITIVDA